MATPTKKQNPNGYHKRFQLKKIDGKAVDKNAEYFVLRLDDGGFDPHHIAASRRALMAYATTMKRYMPELSYDLIKRFGPTVNQLTGVGSIGEILTAIKGFKNKMNGINVNMQGKDFYILAKNKHWDEHTLTRLNTCKANLNTKKKHFHYIISDITIKNA